MKKIELASYPKCGNTWLRHLLSKHFELNIHTDIPDFHQRHGDTEAFIKPVVCENQKFGFYKSHVPNVKVLNPDVIIVIYRHPLDVFLSCLNYFYINNWGAHFVDGKCKKVEQLKESGQLGDYFKVYFDEVGEKYFEGLLGRFSNYFAYLDYVSGLDNVKMLKYEDLYDGRKSFFDAFFSDLLGVDIQSDESLFDKVDEKTKGSGDSFYWKSTKRNYENFLTDDEINNFENKYSSYLKKYGFS
jgi:hypothetical protein